MKSVPAETPRNARHPQAFQCHHVHHTAWLAPELHSHDCYEVYIHIHGGGTFHLGSSIVQLAPLEALIIPPGQRHGPEEGVLLQDYECVAILLPAPTLEALSFQDFSLQVALDQIISQSGQRIRMLPEHWRNIRPLANSIKNDSPTLHPLERQISMGCLSTLLGVVCYASLLAREAYFTQHTTMQTIRLVSSHISQHFAEDCSLDHLADMFSISKYHLAHRFRSLMGMSVHQYVQRCRISYARRLIHQGEALGDVCQACGYNDYSAFLRAFTRSVGMSPTRWREQQLQRELTP